MLDYETLRVIWWLILGVLLIGFAITDGFDMGVAAIFRFISRSEDERHALLSSVEPVWEGNQVWFILAGGATFAAWPLLYATSFSGLYPAIFLLLLTFILRPVGFGFRSHVDDPRWRNLWDWVLFGSGTGAALLFGVAFGNLFLGVPFHFDALQRPVYTGGFFNLLHPFALTVGVVSLAMLVMHGAAYAALKVEQPLSQRAAALGGIAALVFAAAFLVTGFWVVGGLDGYHIVSAVDPLAPSNPLLKTVERVPRAWLDNYRIQPLLWIAPVGAVLMAVTTWLLLLRRRPGLAFLSSCGVQTCTILCGGFALFPFLLPSSTDPGHSLTVWDASSSAKTLLIMLVAVAIFLPLILAYTSWVYRVLKGRITLAHIRRESGLY